MEIRQLTRKLIWAQAAEQSIDVGQHRAAALIQVSQLLQVVGNMLLGHDRA